MNIKLRDLLKELKNKEKNEHGSIGLAIMISILVLGLAVLVVTSVSLNLKSGKESILRDSTKNAAEAGLNNALDFLNSPKTLDNNAMPINSYKNIETSFKGITKDAKDPNIEYKWLWYAQKSTTDASNYEIVSIGYSEFPTEEKAIKMVTSVKPLEVEKAAYEGTTPAYNLSRNSLKTLGAYSGLNIQLEKDATFGGYASQNGRVPSKADITLPADMHLSSTAKIHTTIAKSKTIGSINYYGTPEDKPFTNRCKIILEDNREVGCDWVNNTTQNQKINVSAPELIKLKEICPLTSDKYPTWKASNYVQANGTLILDPNSLEPCYNKVVFDRNVVLANNANLSNPAVFNALGDVSVAANISVNAPNTAYNNTGSGALVLNTSSFSMANNTAGMPTTRIYADTVSRGSATIGNSIATTSPTLSAEYYGNIVTNTSLIVRANSTLGIDLNNLTFKAPSNGNIFWSVIKEQQHINNQAGGN